MTTWTPAFVTQFGDWLKNPNTFIFGRWQGFPENGLEGGMDLSSPGGTPVYAVADGFIQGVGNFWHSQNLYTPGSGPPGYGVVTERVTMPGTTQQEDLYYQHIDINPALKTCYGGNCGGQYVHKGDLIGNIDNAVGMLEVGFNANWGGVWGGNHPDAWATDPRPMFASLLNAGPPAQTGGTPSAGPGCTNTDPCLGCGAKDSKGYNDCLAASFATQGVGNMPACANCGTTVIQDAVPGLGPAMDYIMNPGAHLDFWKRVVIGTVAVIIILIGIRGLI